MRFCDDMVKRLIFVSTIILSTFTVKGISEYTLSGVQQGAASSSSLSKRSWEIIESALDSAHPGRMMAAVLSVEMMRNERAISLLVRALDARYSMVRAAAVKFLARVAMERGESLPLEKYERFLKSGGLDLQLQVVQALGQVGDASAITFLEPLLKNANPDFPDMALREVTLASMVKLGQKTPAPTISVLKGLLGSTGEKTRKSTVDALGQIKGTESILLLKKALGDRSSQVRFAAALALTKLGDDSAIDLVKAGLRIPDLQTKSIIALYEFGGQEYVQALQRLMEGTDPKGKYKAMSAIRWIVNSGKPFNETVKGLLVKALKDPHPGVHAGAMAAFVKVRGREDLEVLQDKPTDVNDNDYVRAMAAKAVVSLGANGPAIRVLRDTVVSDREVVRKIAIEGLAATGRKDSAQELRRALGDTRSTIRVAAIDGLARINDRPALPLLLNLIKKGGAQWVTAKAADAVVSLAGPDDLELLEPLLEGGQYARIYAAAAIIRLLEKP